MDSQQKPTRPMDGMAPRRSMDMMRRPAGPAPAAAAQPAQPPQPAPAPQPAPRPVAPRPMGAMTRPAGTPLAQRPQAAAQPAAAAKTDGAKADTAKTPRRRAWWVVLQFVIGLLVILGVAAAIVALYIRYYQ